MRQKDNVSFAHVRSRVRIGEETSDDVHELMQRENLLDREDNRYQLEAHHLFATFNAAQEHNMFMLERLQGEIIEVKAQDSKPKHFANLPSLPLL